MMNFADAMQEDAKWTRTENGAVAINSTGHALTDLFGVIGSLREADENRITTLFAEAYREDPLMATKILFYARDIREGLGERKTFRSLLNWLADHHPEAVRPNLDLIGVFGRYDDMYSLVGTKLEDEMWAAMKKQFEEDRRNLEEGNSISLLAKWVKSADASSRKTRQLGILTAQKLGYSVYDFKRLVKRMRGQIGVTEVLMSTGRWDEIKYSAVPSRAMKLYRNAFVRHDEDGFRKYLDAVESGEEAIHSSTLYPYDIVEQYLYRKRMEDRVLEAQWNALPNYVAEGSNVLIMADTSGSMYGRPLATAVGLAIYFAERNAGAYHNLFMTFSETPSIIRLKGETLIQKVHTTMQAPWDMNTDLKAAFQKVLEIAEKGKVPQKDMPKAIVVISDMEIDVCGNKQWTFYDKMTAKFRKAGYQIPNVIFWNVNSRNDIYHADANRKGVQLASGQSVSVFRQIIEGISLTPVQAMERVINSERYACITVDPANERMPGQ